MTSPISVALLTRNGRADLEHLLPVLRGQRWSGPVEIVAVDSGSTDGSGELLATAVDRTLSVSAADFDHGGTRNLAIQNCTGEFVVLLVQDALPTSASWLEALVEPLVQDPSLAATFARQTPRPDASPIVRHNLENWIAGRTEARTSRIADPEVHARSSPMERFLTCAFDNVCSCLRRSVWSEIPFRPAAIAEDLAWAQEVLLAGHGIAYTPDAVVVHSHDRSLAYELARTRLVHHRLQELFGVRTIPTLPHLLRSIVVTVASHRRILATAGTPQPRRSLAKALGLAVIWPLGQYLGGRDGARGLPVGRVPGV